MDVAQLLLNSLSADKNLREPATVTLQEVAKTNLAGYLSTLGQILSGEGQDINVRRAAGLAIKNALTARDPERFEALAREWMQLELSARQNLKSLVLQTLGATESRIGSTSAQVVDAIAQIELPLNRWPDLIKSLLHSITTPTSGVSLRRSALEALGYICEEINASILESQSNDILTAVVSGARKEESNLEIRQAAMRALLNSLDFIRRNFENEMERNYLMQVVCEATQFEDPALQTLALECLVGIVHLYYDHMGFYMDKALVGLTLQLLTRYFQVPGSVDHTVALQAIEFWSTVSEEELSLQMEISRCIEREEPINFPCFNFSQQYAPTLIPILTSLLLKRTDHNPTGKGDDEDEDDDDDEDEWNVPIAAATCLSLLSSCIGGAIVPHVVPFVQQNIQNTQSSLHREASVMAYGSILEGPSPSQLAPLTSFVFPILLSLTKDKSTRVRDTTAWTLGRLCELIPTAIDLYEQYTPLVAVLLQGLTDVPRVACNCAWTLKHIADFFGAKMTENTATGPDRNSIILSKCFEPCIKGLLVATERSDGQINNNNNLRMAAYDSLATWTQYAPDESLDGVQQLAVILIQRLSLSLSAQTLSIDDRMQVAEVQSEICGVLQALLRRLPAQRIAQFADDLMALFLRLFASQAARTSGLLEDVLLAVGAMVHSLEGHFARYMESFLPILVAALANQAEYQVCGIAIGLVGDLSRALGEGLAPYCDTLVSHLIQNLQSSAVHRDVKPPILSCFGDIALAIAGHYAKYVDVTMAVLGQAAKVLPENPNTGDDIMEYMDALMLCIIEGYTGIVQGLKSSNAQSAIGGHVNDISHVIDYVSRYTNRPDELTKAAVGLLGDLADALGVQMGPLMAKSGVSIGMMVQNARNSGEPSTREIGRWAYVILKRVQS